MPDAGMPKFGIGIWHSRIFHIRPVLSGFRKHFETLVMTLKSVEISIFLQEPVWVLSVLKN